MTRGIQLAFVLGALAVGVTTSTVTAFAHHIISTTPTPSSGIVGQTALKDSAMLGGTTPDRKVKFFLWAPGSQCSGAANLVFSESEHPTAAQGNGTVPLLTSGSYTATVTGIFQWTAEILNGSAVESGPTHCGDEPVTISKADPNVATTPSAGGGAGGVISDSATVTGGDHPTGRVQFELFGPADPNCTGAPIQAGINNLDQHGAAISNAETAATAGTYHWIAVYLGDTDNSSVTSSCRDEPVAVGKASPVLRTTPSSGGAVGTTISDAATVSGGSMPTGTVTFKLYGPGNAQCSGAASFTSSVALTAPVVRSAAFSGTSNAGTYSWVATYSGDGNNQAATSGCGAETVLITSSSGPTPNGGVLAITTPTTPDTGGGEWAGLGIGGLLVLGGPCVVLAGFLTRVRWNRRT